MVGLLACLLMPLSQAAVNPVPVIMIHMDPTQQSVNATVAQVSAVFNGEVAVDKLPVQTVTVDIVASVSTGWAISLEPTQMIFTSTTPQCFTCTVTVPQGTPLTYTQVNVSGTGTTALFSVTASCTSILNVDGPTPPKSSGNSTTNSTKKQTNTGDGNLTNNTGAGNDASFLLGLSKERFMLVAASVVVIVSVVAAGGYRISRRQKRARQQND